MITRITARRGKRAVAVVVETTGRLGPKGLDAHKRRLTEDLDLNSELWPNPETETTFEVEPGLVTGE
jgi:hypothetical protein